MVAIIAMDIKEELRILIDRENDLHILDAIKTILKKSSMNSVLKERLTSRALKSERDIKEGRTMNRKAFEDKLDSRLGEWKSLYTEQSLDSLEEALRFLIKEQSIPVEKVLAIKTRLLDVADGLALFPETGQIEEYLEHLKKGHRRLIEGHFKIIYLLEGEIIYITDFFDTRQAQEDMKGW